MTKNAILFVNLGSPKSLLISDISKYLTEFLMDKNVVDIPYVFRFFLVRSIIIPFRKRRTQTAYAKIWGENSGSPLIYNSCLFQKKVQKQLKTEIALAMRYQEPSIEKVVSSLYSKGIRNILLFPMYPHYAISTFRTVIEKLEGILKWYSNVTCTVAEPFYNKEFYIQALANSIQPYLANNYDKIIFSYHGIPKRHITKLDKNNYCFLFSGCCEKKSNQSVYCYRHQVFETTRLVAENLGLHKNQFLVSFQSRIGKGWLKPYTDIELSRLLNLGNKKIAIVCPSFLVDCLETLEEIQIRERLNFFNNGGEKLDVIPCLNKNKDWILKISSYIQKKYEKFA